MSTITKKRPVCHFVRVCSRRGVNLKYLDQSIHTASDGVYSFKDAQKYCRVKNLLPPLKPYPKNSGIEFDRCRRWRLEKVEILEISEISTPPPKEGIISRTIEWIKNLFRKLLGGK